MLESMLRVGLKAVDGYFGLLRLLSVQMTIVDATTSAAAQQGPVPPLHLRLRVHGRADLPSFLEVGFRCARDIELALARVGKSFRDFDSILDFGCGSGRTLRWLPSFTPTAHLSGSDIDGDAIDWIDDNLSFVSASQNGAKSALFHPDDSFDLVYAISVFTHMDEDHQFFWLEELRRVLKPNGLLVASLHGHDLWKDFSPDALAQIREDGVLVSKTRLWDGVFPEWYQNTYHDVDYVTKNFGRYFEILGYFPLALDSNHDIVVLRKNVDIMPGSAADAASNAEPDVAPDVAPASGPATTKPSPSRRQRSRQNRS